MTKLRAMMILESVEQVGAVVEFCRTMEIQLDMGLMQEAPKEQFVAMGEREPGEKDVKAHQHCAAILERGPLIRPTLVRELAKRMRKDPKIAGMAVKRMLSDNALVVM